MILSYRITLLPLLWASVVLGHGQVRSFITSTNTYPAADAYSSSPNPNSPIRKLNTYGPAAPFTGADITCGPGGNSPAAVVAPVTAGSSVTFDWGQWTSSPVMTYIAACPSGCATFKGDTGKVWVKIQQDGFVPSRSPQWAEQIIEKAGQSGHGKWTVQIPSSIPDGEYILRHEILGLHVAYGLNGAQFYPNCVQIKVTGGGNTPLPTGVAFPGAYQPTDPGVLVQLYWFTASNNTYVIPGGPVLLGGNENVVTPPSPGSSTGGGSSGSGGGAGGAPLYGQCGGQGWNGPTTCASGTCTATGSYYSQCVP